MIHTILADTLRDLKVLERITAPDAWVFVIPSKSMPTTATWYRRLEDAISAPGLQPGTVFYPKMNTWDRGEVNQQFLYHESRVDIAAHRSIGAQVERSGAPDLNIPGLRGACLFKVQDWTTGVGRHWIQAIPGGFRLVNAHAVLLGLVYLYHWGPVLEC